jgi:hypothetical protein
MSDTIPAIFYFDFSFDDNSTKAYGFAGIAEKENIIRFNFEDHQDAIRNDLEDAYGVHDWSSSPDDRVYVVGGYTTYEVEKESALKLVKGWKKELEKLAILGVQFGPVVEIDIAGTDTDYDIYLKIKAKEPNEKATWIY